MDHEFQRTILSEKPFMTILTKTAVPYHSWSLYLLALHSPLHDIRLYCLFACILSITLFSYPMKILCWVWSPLNSPATNISWKKMNECLNLYVIVFPNIYIIIPFAASLMAGRSVWRHIISLFERLFTFWTEIELHLWFDIILYISFYLLLLPNQRLLLPYYFCSFFSAATLHVCMLP